MDCKRKFPDCGIPLRTVCECCKHIEQLNFEIKLLQEQLDKANDLLSKFTESTRR